MTRQRVDSLDPAFAGAFGAGEEGATPARSEHAASPAAVEPARHRRSWLGIALRIVRDAAIAVALMTMVPIALVAIKGDYFWRFNDMGVSTQARLKLMERVRPFALPSDPSITPMQAGLAFAALQSPPKDPGVFVINEPVVRPKMSWRDAPEQPGIFPNGFNNLYHGPSSQSILEAVQKGFTPDEAKFLRTLATAPAWREFDLLARAPAADLIGGRFRLPFAPGATIYEMPLADFKSTKEMAYAAVSRAAYHMSIGQRDSAETILRSIISFGFVLVDNGTTLIDELIGNVIVGVGRDGLQRFYTITNDPRGASAALAPIRQSDLTFRGGPDTKRLPLDEVRAKLIARADNRSLHPGQRYNALMALSASTCTNVPEMLFGRRQDARDAIDRARRDLARYPSEREVVNLIDRFAAPRVIGNYGGPIHVLATSAGAVAGTVLRNPNLATCSRLISGAFPSY